MPLFVHLSANGFHEKRILVIKFTSGTFCRIFTLCRAQFKLSTGSLHTYFPSIGRGLPTPVPLQNTINTESCKLQEASECSYLLKALTL